MADGRNEFGYESLQEIESVARYLRAIADGLSNHGLELASGGRGLVLEPRGLLRLRITAKRGKHRARLALKVSWREDDPSRDDDAGALQITPQRSE